MIYEKKPWLASYDEGIHESMEIPEISIKQAYLDAFNTYSEQAAFHYMDEDTTFGQLSELSGRFATALNRAGFGKGDVVAICMPNTPQYLIAIAGAIRAGCAVSGLAPLLMPDEMAYQLNNCGASVLVILDMLFEPKFLPIADQLDQLKRVLVTGVFDPHSSVSDYPTGTSIDGMSVDAFYSFFESAESD